MHNSKRFMRQFEYGILGTQVTRRKRKPWIEMGENI
jgi:hypothetical protein